MSEPSITEGKLQEVLVGLLNTYARQDICWWACPNGDWREPRVGARLKRQGVRPGASDLMFVIDNIFYGLELKRDRQSGLTGNQKLFKQALERAGGVFREAHGLMEAIDCLVDMDVFVAGITNQQLYSKGVLHGAFNQGPKKRSRNIAAPSARLRAARHWQNYIGRRMAKPNFPSS